MAAEVNPIFGTLLGFPAGFLARLAAEADGLPVDLAMRAGALGLTVGALIGFLMVETWNGTCADD